MSSFLKKPVQEFERDTTLASMGGTDNLSAYAQTLIAVGAAVLCFLLLLGCTICWRLRAWNRRAKARQPSERLSVSFQGTPFGPTSSSSIKYTLDPADLRTGPTFSSVTSSPFLPPSTPDPNEARVKRFSCPDPPSAELLGRRDNLRRSKTLESVEDGPIEESSSVEIDPPRGPLPTVSGGKTTLHFSLFHSAFDHTLTVNILGVSNLPRTFSMESAAFVKVWLLPSHQEAVQTTIRRKSFNPQFNESFKFKSMEREDIDNVHLRFAVYVKQLWDKKDGFVGEVLFPGAEWDRRDVPTTFSRELKSSKTKGEKLRKISSSIDLEELDEKAKSCELFVLLQYQAMSNRMKVLIRKAENLTKKKMSLPVPGTADHYIIVRLLHRGNVKETKETKSASGSSPVWNQPFLFDIPSDQVEDYSLEFVVMRGRIYTRDGVIGSVLIGPAAPPSGVSHWNETLQPRARESARWHTIQPASGKFSPKRKLSKESYTKAEFNFSSN
ncbi:synaptotagmin-4-like isoform X1 [Branchiostoma floridae]|uniref:Synaptotagmin-4-like isoform X1 n=1 Tax=Branchiostoma floridae TaxID=7739 RepID=A0A9J7KPA2_BRAFL|nr:synaptotagmin-4-like isoform X1 [Branchiostoma floridae]